RLANAAIAGTAFAGMGGAAAALNATGAFAAPGARSLLSNVTYSALSGAAGGASYAEANALLKQGKALPQLNDLTTDVVSGAAFGGAMGGIAYGMTKLTPPQSNQVTSNNGEVTTQSGQGLDKVVSPPM